MTNTIDYIAIDFETANNNRYSAISIGLVCFKNGIECDNLSCLIKPPTDYFVQAWTDTIHHICYEDVKNQPYFDLIWKDKISVFFQKYQDYPLVAHNATFDMNVLRECLNYYEIGKPDLYYFDSLTVSRRTWTNQKCHKLTVLGQMLEIDYLAHDALEDARTCGLIVANAALIHDAKTTQDLLKKCKIKLKQL